ncbi:preprotein translocase subunit SecY [Candidatus Gracilibacteria bacterium GN02-872]|nr:preprotein translocase subunit SecY [Candidatus Gracilibacteria bacterium GN02-872]
MIKSFKSVFANKSIRKKIVATLLLVLVYKLLSVIPVYGVDTTKLAAIIEQNKGLSFFSALMGGGLSHFSIILMGLSPYINAMIIIQLLGVIVPKIGDLQKEGEQGQKTITKWTRWLTLPLAFLQSYGMIVLLNTLAHGTIIDLSDLRTVLMAMTIITAGTIFLVWLGEIMTEKGIGNGISIIITAGVLAGVPSVITQHISAGSYGLFAGLVVATLFIIYVIIKFTEGNRRIPVIYTRTGREEKSYFPIRVNQAGMVPIIFAISLITFPSIIGQIMSASSSDRASAIGKFLLEHFNMSNPSWAFIVLYFLLVIGFSFFYVSITFNTENVAESIQKRGGYIPGIRPGKETASYLSKVSAHLNLFGGGFLALIAVLPYIMTKIMGQSVDFIISASGLIIIVSVILDVVRKVDSELKMYDYSKYN